MQRNGIEKFMHYVMKFQNETEGSLIQVTSIVSRDEKKPASRIVYKHSEFVENASVQ